MIDLFNLTEVQHYTAEFVKYLMPRFFMNNCFEVTIETIYSDREDWAGHYQPDTKNRKITITINMYQNETIEDLNDTIIHEFIHCCMSDITAFAVLTVPNNDETREILQEVYQEKIETVCNRLTRFVLEETGLVKEFTKNYKKNRL